MRPSTLVVIADRGCFRAYKVNETATRGPSLQLVQGFDIPDSNGRAGAHHATPMTDWPELEAEMNRRVCKQLADEIAQFVRNEGCEGWSFAAPASIHSTIVDSLPPEIRERIVEHVKSDLTKTEPAKLAKHFRSLQPI